MTHARSEIDRAVGGKQVLPADESSPGRMVPEESVRNDGIELITWTDVLERLPFAAFAPASVAGKRWERVSFIVSSYLIRLLRVPPKHDVSYLDSSDFVATCSRSTSRRISLWLSPFILEK